jgi:uncharacterized protein (TIRG00374 family)
VWTLRGESPSEIWAVISTSNVALMIAAVLVATAVFPLRAIRWRIILEPVAPRVPIAPLWRAIAIGVMVSNIYPARLGEIARAYALTRETNRVSLTSSVASLAVDRVFDALTLMLLMVSAMLAPDFPKGMTVGGQPVQRGAALFAAGALGLFVALYVIVAFPQQLVRLYAAVVGRVAPRLVHRGSAIIHAFSEGLGVLRSPRRFAAVFFWALVHWLVNALAFWIGFKAVGIDVPFSAANFLQGIIAIGVALPSSPGFFGVFEAAAKVGLEVYGVPGGRAISWAIGFHILSFIPITLIGLYYFARLGLHFSDFKAQPNEA